MSLRSEHFLVIRGNCRRNDDSIKFARDVFGTMSAVDACSQPAQSGRFPIRAQIGAGHLDTLREKNGCQSAHADAADAYEMNPRTPLNHG